MRRIGLTRGKFAIVDDADFEWLNRWKWCASKGRATWYAVRGTGPRIRRKLVSMHSMLCLGNPEVDHRNGDGLDNRRSNLRPATRKQNGSNLPGHRNSTSRFKGVSFDTWAGRWVASIGVNGRSLKLGRFDSQKRAAEAYDSAARKHHGEFARTNFGGT